MKRPTFTMKGYSPETPPLSIQVKTCTEEGFGYAESEAIQFNVNIPTPPSGAIFVDPNNDGIIEIALTSEHKIEDAWAIFPLSAEPISALRYEIAKSISDNGKSATFHTRTGDPGKLIFTTKFVLQFAPS
ncbi:hypothetical protein ACVNP3_18870 [Pseudomonas chlororaphis subsp. piscium]